MHATSRDHAIVIGGSFAGLAAAAALASRFSRVTVLERHARPDGGVSIVAHGRYPHILLEGGSHALDRLVPGFMRELVESGAPTCDRDQVQWWSGGWRTRRATDTGARVLCTRALLESKLRARVEQLPGVTFEYGTAISGLVATADRVTGVRTPQGVLAADLVVDAGGRGSRAGVWLSAIGYAEPPVEELRVELGYLVVTLARRLDACPTRALVVQNMAPEQTRLGVAVAIEGDRTMVLLGGYFGDIPPTDREGYIAFARSLPVDDVARVLEDGEQIGEALPYLFKSSRRVHVEQVRTPAGFVVLGDALCSFNPLYGQGMSVAALQADHLGRALDRDELPATFHRELAAIADQAWMVAAGGDLAYPQVEGRRSLMMKFMQRYMRRLFRACSADGKVVDVLWDVTNLLVPPSRLLHPAVVARVVRAGGTRRANRTATPQLAMTAPAD